MGTVTFSEVKRPEGVVDHPTPSRAEVKGIVYIYIYIYIYILPLWAFVAGSRLKLYFINWRRETSAFKVPAIQITNNSPHVAPTTVSLSSSQQLCTFCCSGQYE